MHEVYCRRVRAILDDVVVYELINLIKRHSNFAIIHCMLECASSQIRSHFYAHDLVSIHYMNRAIKRGELLFLLANVRWPNNMGWHW